MSHRIRRFTAVLAAALMLASVAPTTALGANNGEDANVPVTFDVIMLRPVGFVTLGVGTGLFLGSLPLLLVTRPMDIDKSANNLVAKPARFLWKDELGGH